MGASRVSLRSTAAVVFTLLQIRALISAKTTEVSVVEGQRFDFRCDYSQNYTNHSKYFCLYDDGKPSGYLIRSEGHDRWETSGRFALYDNTSGPFFTVSLDEPRLDDSGTYWCGVDVAGMPDIVRVIRLQVFPRLSQVIDEVSPPPEIHKLSFSLYLTAVMCVAAMLFVCLFTIGLLLAVKNRRARSRRNAETSSDYEPMKPTVRAEPERCCSYPGCAELSAAPSAASMSPGLTAKQRESAFSASSDDYADVEAPRCICHYEHLDPSSQENHVYLSIQGNCDPKHEPSKETIHSG
ncbi:CMRF35-like molecule 6 [Salarias fasciatus]|uniref:CMRF35-like molecule 6 n=1 Tax=Salarias fasciatus TaxID=181472 RepID=UPI001176FFE7|nr:CMRF35-like molecule 6 [Salarias fasciatus]